MYKNLKTVYFHFSPRGLYMIVIVHFTYACHNIMIHCYRNYIFKVLKQKNILHVYPFSYCFRVFNFYVLSQIPTW